MTDDELKELVASIAISQKKTDKQLRETDAELKELAASMAISQKNTKAELKELVAGMAASQKNTDQQIKELGKQIGGLGRKFGSFTEGLALPSMEHILRKQFNMEIISPSVRAEKGGQNYEIDVLAYANSSVNELYVVEVKSHLREEGIIQLQKIITNFRQLFPEHKDKKVFGILAAIDMSSALKERVLSLGFYTAKVREDIFSLDVPENFQARAY